MIQRALIDIIINLFQIFKSLSTESVGDFAEEIGKLLSGKCTYRADLVWSTGFSLVYRVSSLYSETCP